MVIAESSRRGECPKHGAYLWTSKLSKFSQRFYFSMPPKLNILQSMISAALVGAMTLLCVLTQAADLCFAVQNSAVKTESTPPTQRPEIERRQQKLLNDYRLLEEKLFTLYQYEKDKNPTRSKLLEKAYQKSQQASTIERLQQATGLLSEAKLKQAEAEQAQTLADFNNLLALLQSEDRGKRIRDELQRYQEYLKEVERLLRIQKGLRGQTEGGGDEHKIAQSEAQAADRAKKLAKEIQYNEEQPDPELIDSGDSDDLEGEAEAKDNADGEGQAEYESKDDNTNDVSPNDGEAEPPQSDGEQNGQQPSDGGSQQSDAESEKQSPSKPASGDPQPASDAADAPDQDGQESEAESANPIRKRIANAEDLMRKAQQALQQAKRDDAADQMREAEKEIAEAKKQLEEILRQLREEEVERTLAMLEGRFRKMLQRQMEVRDSTEKLNKTAADQRATDFEIQTGKLSSEQNSIATDASRALLLLREDGSSVAFPATVEEMHLDMLQIAARLSAAKVGDFTVELENEVIGTLNYLVDALAQAQMDNEQEKSAGRPPGGGAPPNPGEDALVGKIAELKMLRGLQERIHKRHQRYAKTLNRDDDPAATADNPDLIAGLKRLAEKQLKLTRIAQDIVNERNE